ncbi:MAG: hypothetical protein JWO82_344 [Akkermansiaceae bacterium]|nr:hypothetical protein [Akkermansiaceae bacterium]
MSLRTQLHTSSQMFRSFIPVLSCAAVLIGVTHAQDYQLKNGRRIPAAQVKAAGDNFTAVLNGIGGNPETLNFGLKDIAQVSIPEPAELGKARALLVNGKAAEAAEAVKPALEKTKALQSIPGSWWPDALVVQIDALAAAGKSITDLAGADEATLRKLPPSDADEVQEMIKIASVAKDAKPETIEKIKDVATRTASSWIQGRAWLEIGNLYANQGKMEDAVKAWLRVPVFSGAEKDLALRGTLAAARGLQQMSLPLDGIQLLDDYLTDNQLTSYKDLIESEKKKLTPKDKATGKN